MKVEVLSISSFDEKEVLMWVPFGIPIWTLESESYPDILAEHGMSEDDPGAASLSSGPNSAHWWVVRQNCPAKIMLM